MIWLAYPAAIIMGVLLGLLGGGGSVLTFPILVYLVGMSSVEATTYSLFIVGFAALSGSFSYIRKGLVHWRSVMLFGIPSIVSIYFSRKIIFPALPVNIPIFGYPVHKDTLVLIVFAIFMLLAAWSMIRRPKNADVSDAEKNANAEQKYLLLIIEGFAIGMIVGMIGAGGGFLIIPALVILAGLPMKMAVGTSLMLIFINSTIGFLGDMQNHIQIDWKFMLIFTAFAFAGIIIGTLFSKKITGEQLRPFFGWFILVMGLFIIIEELFIKA